MSLYRNLSKISFLKKSYAFKFLFVAFIGINLPLIGMLLYVLYVESSLSNEALLTISLLLTLAVTLITLLVLNNLMRPILLASKALKEYRLDRTLSHLPIRYQDEAGLLMRNIQEMIYETESFISEKQDLIYMLSHDLKNFAGNPQGLAQLILKENPTPEIKELAELICQSTAMQFRYIENFIRLLKEQEDIAHMHIEPHEIALCKIIPFIKEQVAHNLQHKNIKIELNIEVEEAHLRIEEGLLIQVLVNLIGNAIKFSYKDSVIKVSSKIDNKQLVLAVKDSGVGFNQLQMESLFKKFTNLGKVGTDNEPSTGIGLYLCKKIIEKGGGKLIAVSEGKNKGAEFKIIFDLDEE